MTVTTWQPGGAVPPPPPYPPGDPRLGALQAGYPRTLWNAPAVQLSPYAAAPRVRQSARSLAAIGMAGAAVVTVLGLLLAGGSLNELTAGRTATPTAAAPPTTTTYTQVPTPRVVGSVPAKAVPMTSIDLGASSSVADAVPKIEAFVEQARGHTFRRPVSVTPLADKAFLAKLHATDTGDSGQAAALAGTDATFEALHLIPRHSDLARLLSEGTDSAVGGFYDFRTKRLYVRSAALNPLAQTIVAHELTHALDDQYFDLARVQAKARDGDQSEAIRSLMEGDARSVEDRFKAALVPAERKRVAAEEQAEFGSADPSAETAPFLDIYSYFPYEIGEQFVNYLRAHGGADAVDAAFRVPPTSTLQIVDPRYAFLDRHDPVQFAFSSGSTAGASSRPVDEDALGMLGLAAVLSEKAPRQLLEQEAPLYWNGDHYRTTHVGSLMCVRDTMESISPLGRDKIYSALRTWAATHAGASVTRLADPLRLELTSCVG